MEIVHQPVMLSEFLRFFEGRDIKVFVDGTLGMAGHSKALLEAHPEIEKLIAFDQDEGTLLVAKERLLPWKNKVELIHANFRKLKSFVKEEVDGVFLDIGLSSVQLDDGRRGFSFLRDGPLDMRMDRSSPLTAEEVVNRFSKEKLEDIFREGEERRARQVAKAICEARRKRRIESVNDLLDVLKGVLKRGGKIHPATLVFQALRIVVNDELGALREGIKAGGEILRTKGRIGVISFHSLEDRIVKYAFREDHSLQILTKKPLVASREETRKNPRSRSAKMRFGEKI